MPMPDITDPTYLAYIQSVAAKTGEPLDKVDVRVRNNMIEDPITYDYVMKRGMFYEPPKQTPSIGKSANMMADVMSQSTPQPEPAPAPPKPPGPIGSRAAHAADIGAQAEAMGPYGYTLPAPNPQVQPLLNLFKLAESLQNQPKKPAGK